jgi:hypothetical protein
VSVVDLFTNLVAEHGLTAVIGVLAVGCVAVWCLLGIALYAAKEHRIRRAETKAIADLKTAAAWETFDARRGIRIAENYANNQDIRDRWQHLPAPKETGS